MLNKPLFKQLAWAFYLACSWTWCIGMFLPVILQKDFGNGAWLFFMLCNVVGATAFPFFINSANQSQYFVKQHTLACTIFSATTIIFQLFFVGWVLSYLSNSEILFALMLIGILYMLIRGTDFTMAAIVLWLLSFALFVSYMFAQPSIETVKKLSDQFIAINPLALYALPLLAVGFLLCPYLDLTFHKVVQLASTKAERGNRISFLVGFLLLFSTLMIFSLISSDTAGRILLNPRELFEQHTVLIKALLFYFILQASFTSMAHWYEMKKHINSKQKWSIVGWVTVAIALAFFASIPMNEITYRLFMSFYGIMVPVYVWMIAFNKKSASNITLLVLTILSLTLAGIPLLFTTTQYYYCYPAAVMIILAARFPSLKVK